MASTSNFVLHFWISSHTWCCK